jgi:hypothetical protein
MVVVIGLVTLTTVIESGCILSEMTNNPDDGASGGIYG